MQGDGSRPNNRRITLSGLDCIDCVVNEIQTGGARRVNEQTWTCNEYSTLSSPTTTDKTFHDTISQLSHVTRQRQHLLTATALARTAIFHGFHPLQIDIPQPIAQTFATGLLLHEHTDRQTHTGQTHDTRCRNRCHKSTPFFWRPFLVRVSCKSGTGFVWQQIPASIRTLVLFQVQGCVHVLLRLLLFGLLCLQFLLLLLQQQLRIDRLSFQLYFQPCLFSAPDIFIPDAYETKNRRRKMELIYGACVMDLSATDRSLYPDHRPCRQKVCH